MESGSQPWVKVFATINDMVSERDPRFSSLLSNSELIQFGVSSVKCVTGLHRCNPIIHFCVIRLQVVFILVS